MEQKRVYLGSDHAGFKLKNAVKRYLDSLGVVYEDLGNTRYQEHDDYPIYAAKVARKVAKEKTHGILFCGSAEGMCIAANKIRGIRAVAVNNVRDAYYTRIHNDANILCLSGWNTKRPLAEKIIKTFLFTLFSNEERHKRRIKQISALQ
jgi:ribose 5-phosphate isomerase B